MLICLSTGCISGGGNWGDGTFPDRNRLGAALKTAATAKQTWMPVVGAALLQIGDVDEQWSEDLAEDQPLFGDDAQSTSSDLRDAATAAYVITALAADSNSFGGKLRGLSVGAGTMILDGIASQGLKDLTGRDRPDDSNDESLPSGHASKASSRTNMAIRNLDYIDLAPWQRQTATWLMHGIAVSTGLARVEAEKHFLSDVLVGYALGHFVSTFMYEAFLEPSGMDMQLSFTPVERGGAFTVTVPLR